MIPELGHFALILVFCLSVALAVLPMVGSFTNNAMLMRSGRTADSARGNLGFRVALCPPLN